MTTPKNTNQSYSNQSSSPSSSVGSLMSSPGSTLESPSLSPQQESNEKPLLDLPALRERARSLEPVLRLGKNGLSEGALKEMIIQLKQKRLIKIKLLKSILEGKDKKTLAREIAEKTGAVLVH